MRMFSQDLEAFKAHFIPMILKGFVLTMASLGGRILGTRRRSFQDCKDDAVRVDSGVRQSWCRCYRSLTEFLSSVPFPVKGDSLPVVM